MRADYQRVIKTTQEFFQRTFLSLAPPVDVERGASILGISVLQCDLEAEISGYLFLDGRGAPIIGVNAKHDESRRRFSIAHELGHYMLHAPLGGEASFVDKGFVIMNRDSTSSLGVDVKEIEANFFAAEVLMPAENLYRDLSQHKFLGDGDKICEHLAMRYVVSPSAMRFRLSNLGFVRV